MLVIKKMCTSVIAQSPYIHFQTLHKELKMYIYVTLHNHIDFQTLRKHSENAGR